MSLNQEHIWILMAQGVPIRKVAAMLKISRHAVKRELRRMNSPAQEVKQTPNLDVIREPMNVET